MCRLDTEPTTTPLDKLAEEERSKEGGRKKAAFIPMKKILHRGLGQNFSPSESLYEN